MFSQQLELGFNYMHNPGIIWKPLWIFQKRGYAPWDAGTSVSETDLSCMVIFSGHIKQFSYMFKSLFQKQKSVLQNLPLCFTTHSISMTSLCHNEKAFYRTVVAWECISKQFTHHHHTIEKIRTSPWQPPFFVGLRGHIRNSSGVFVSFQYERALLPSFKQLDTLFSHTCL